MFRNFIFVVILLATLSIVNATTSFQKCPLSDAEAITVTINPDPPVVGKDLTFDVSGTLSKEITSDDKLIITFTSGLSVSKEYISDVPPTQPNTPFKTSATHTVPSEITGAYIITVSISTVPDPRDEIGCAFAAIDISIPPTTRSITRRSRQYFRKTNNYFVF